MWTPGEDEVCVVLAHIHELHMDSHLMKFERETIGMLTSNWPLELAYLILIGH